MSKVGRVNDDDLSLARIWPTQKDSDSRWKEVRSSAGIGACQLR